MSADAIARLRAAVDWVGKGGALVVDPADLRALLDAHDEALDALANVLAWRDAAMRSEVLPDRDEVDDIVAARAVLAKPGRR